MPQLFRKPPTEAGLDPVALAEAVRFAVAHETPWPRDLRANLEAGHFEKPPHNAILGPIRPRGAPNGVVLRDGAVVAEWGDPRQVDFTSASPRAISVCSRELRLRWADRGSG